MLSHEIDRSLVGIDFVCTEDEAVVAPGQVEGVDVCLGGVPDIDPVHEPLHRWDWVRARMSQSPQFGVARVQLLDTSTRVYNRPKRERWAKRNEIKHDFPA